MPYGRRPYRRTSVRTIRRPVRRYKRRPTRAAPYRRKASTAALARRAFTLAKANHRIARGSYQTNLHTNRNTGGVRIKAATPFCFHVPTPRQNESMWQFLQVGGGPGYAATVVDSFVKPTLAMLTGGAGTQAHNMWDDANDDVFNGKYMLQSINYTFTVKASQTQSQAVRFRIDFVKPRLQRLFRAVVGTQVLNGANYRLPDCLGAFNGLLYGANRVNPMYWTFVRKPVYFTVRPSELWNSNGSLEPQERVFQKHVKITLNQVYNPRDVGTTAADESNAYLSIPDNQHMWCIVSTDAPGPMLNEQVPALFMTRQFSWRDRAGHAA